MRTWPGASALDHEATFGLLVSDHLWAYGKGGRMCACSGLFPAHFLSFSLLADSLLAFILTGFPGVLRS